MSLSSSRQICAQETYAMDNGLVTDCSGFLTDSGEGGPYSADEFFTFTVLVDESQDVPIVVDFLSDICIETNFDSLVIYDGADSESPVLGVFSGFDFTPPSVVSSSGAVTFVFASDASANYCGFSLSWEALAPPPLPPVMSLVNPVDCPASEVQIAIVPPVGCEDVDLESWTVLSGGTIQGTSLGQPTLICQGDSATGLSIPIDAPLEANCGWMAQMTMGKRDACDSLHVFEVPLNLNITTCPILLDFIDMPAAVCPGTCPVFWFEAKGCLAHEFNWIATSDGMPIGGPDSLTTGLEICVEAHMDTVNLMLEVVQIPTGLSQIFEWFLPVESPEWTFSTENMPLCSEAEGPMLTASPSGGLFFSNEAVMDSVSGDVDATGLQGEVDFSYMTTNGCLIDTTLTFEWLEVGPDLTTCLGGPDLIMEGMGVNGTWSGNNIQSNGLYTPATPGWDTLIYASNHCSDTLLAEVILQEPPIVIPPICATESPFSLPDLPTLGTWTGPGIADEFGSVIPSNIPIGPITWVYELTGCSQLATSQLLPIAVEPASMVTCPEQSALPVSSSSLPSGGLWSGPGVGSFSGVFNPGNAPEGWNLEIIYTAPNGCQDTVFVNNITTQIDALDIETCQGIDAVEVHEAGWGFQPWCGAWSGPGISPGAGCEWHWDPASVPVGQHTLTFTANTCSDSVTVTVWPSGVDFAEPEGWSACELDNPIDLAPANLWPGGIWSGPGVQPMTGEFDPGIAAGGDHWVVWTAPGGCTDSTLVQVETWVQASLGTLPDPWCHTSAPWSPDLIPSTSTWMLDGNPSIGFSMDTLLAGPHELTVTWNGQSCSSADTLMVNFEPPLMVELTVNDTVLCPASGTLASAVGDGGLTGAEYNWSWSHGGFPTNATNYVPTSSDHLIVTLSDGCSDAVSDSVWVEVASTPEWSWLPDAIDCFGLPSGGALSVSPAIFELNWEDQIQPPSDLQGTDTLWWDFDAPAGTNLVFNLTDMSTDCQHDTMVSIPSYTPINMGFQPNPGLGPDSTCVPWELVPIALLDFSAFVAQGLWWVENDDGEVVWSEPYALGQTPAFAPPLPGSYSLHVTGENEGGCSDEFNTSICVSPPTVYFLPDQFSPNGDGINDRLRVHCEPLDDFKMSIFNAFGEKVAFIEDPNLGWDGRQRGVDAPSGSYGVRLEMWFTSGVYLTANASILLIR